MNQDPNNNDWLTPPAPARPVSRRRTKTIGLVAAGVVAGGVLAGTIGATAATSSSSGTTSSGTSSSSSGTAGQPPANAHSSTPVRSDETPVSSTLTAQLTQKALAKVPGGTVYRVETDSGDAAYEAHMTKSDGTEVTVKFDKSLNVTAVETGMGKGDPNTGTPGGHGPGDHDGDGPHAPTSTGTSG